MESNHKKLAVSSDRTGRWTVAKECVSEAGLAYRVLDDLVETTPGRVAIGTMHLAKGLEFRAVAVMACHDETLP